MRKIYLPLLLLSLPLALMGLMFASVAGVPGDLPLARQTQGRRATAGRSLPLGEEAWRAYATLPTRFEANVGQVAEEARFVVRGIGYTAALTSADVILAFRGSPVGTESGGPAVRINLIGGNSSPSITPMDRFPGRTNYFIGADPTKWWTDVPSYARVKYEGVYAGVDVIYYGNGRQLEYDFVIAPGANLAVIRLRFDGADELSLDEEGNLIIRVAGGTLIQPRPAMYQEDGGIRTSVSGGYVLREHGEVGLQAAGYDSTRALFVDPVLKYSTYFGGSSGEAIGGVAIDGDGYIYLAGATGSEDLPLRRPFQRRYRNGDSFIAKLTPDGSSLVYSTYLGGSLGEGVTRIAVGPRGEVLVSGTTWSSDFPTVSAFQPVFRGGVCHTGPCPDGFVAKVNPEGSALEYATYLGGWGDDQAIDIAVDIAGNAYVTGWTEAGDFPTVRPFQPSLKGIFDTFVAKFAPTGTPIYSTYLGGTDGYGGEGGSAVAADSNGSAYVGGDTDAPDFPTVNPLQPDRRGRLDAFITKFNPEGSALVYSTYLGGVGGDGVRGIVVDARDRVNVAGYTDSTDFPTRDPFQPENKGQVDGVVARLNRSGSALLFSSYIGGSKYDVAYDIGIDALGNVYVGGTTDSEDFPSLRSFQPAPGGGSDGFVASISPGRSKLRYSSYLGGSQAESVRALAVDASGNVYAAGTTWSADFPTKRSFQDSLRGQTDVFLARIAP